MPRSKWNGSNELWDNRCDRATFKNLSSFFFNKVDNFVKCKRQVTTSIGRSLVCRPRRKILESHWVSWDPSRWRKHNSADGNAKEDWLVQCLEKSRYEKGFWHHAIQAADPFLCRGLDPVPTLWATLGLRLTSLIITAWLPAAGTATGTLVHSQGSESSAPPSWDLGACSPVSKRFVKAGGLTLLRPVRAHLWSKACGQPPPNSVTITDRGMGGRGDRMTSTAGRPPKCYQGCPEWRDHKELFVWKYFVF